MGIMEEAKRQYFELKKLYEEVELRAKNRGMKLPPRSAAFYDLQRKFEPSFEDEILIENNDVPRNKGYLVPRNGSLR